MSIVFPLNRRSINAVTGKGLNPHDPKVREMQQMNLTLAQRSVKQAGELVSHQAVPMLIQINQAGVRFLRPKSLPESLSMAFNSYRRGN